jgi:hypothetical protein
MAADDTRHVDNILASLTSRDRRVLLDLFTMQDLSYWTDAYPHKTWFQMDSIIDAVGGIHPSGSEFVYVTEPSPDDLVVNYAPTDTVSYFMPFQELMRWLAGITMADPIRAAMMAMDMEIMTYRLLQDAMTPVLSRIGTYLMRRRCESRLPTKLKRVMPDALWDYSDYNLD